jgi:hypothetical protein
MNLSDLIAMIVMIAVLRYVSGIAECKTVSSKEQRRKEYRRLTRKQKHPHLN